MIKKNTFSKGITYILIVVLCFTNLFLGVKVIKKISDIKKSTEIAEEKEIEDDVIEVFNNNNSNIDNDADTNTDRNKEVYNENANEKKDNIFLRILLSSNIYMKVVYEDQNNEEKTGLSKGNIFTSFSFFLKPNTYIKPYLPAIVNAFNETYIDINESREKEDDDKSKGYTILSDIVFIEDPEEGNNNDESIDNSLGKNEEGNSVEVPQSLTLDHENPYVLLYHTHGTEAYLPVTSGRFHTEKREYNVLSIGEIIGKVLEEKGHKLKHVDIYHDIPSYNQSYIKSLSTVKEELNKNKSIKVIFDIHRDGIEESTGNIEKAQKNARIVIDEKNVATFSMVIGPDSPNKEQIIKFANYIKFISDSMYPGLCKGIIMKPSGKFNQYVSDHYALLEIGSNLNTIDEAKESAKYVGEILNKVLEDISTIE